MNFLTKQSLIAITVLSSFCLVFSEGKLMFDLDAEGRPLGSFNNNVGMRDNRRGNVVNVVSSPVRSGTRSLSYISTKGGRTELAWGPNAQMNTDYWYGYSLYVKQYNEAWGYMSQWHGQPDRTAECKQACPPTGEAWRTPPTAFKVGTRGGKKRFSIEARWSAKKCMCARHDGDDAKPLTSIDFPFKVWQDIIVHIHLDPNAGGKGRIIIWYKKEKEKAYKKIVNYSGPIGYNDQRGTYWCIGMHKSSKGDNIYYDNIRVYRGGGNTEGSEGFNAVNPDRGMGNVKEVPGGGSPVDSSQTPDTSTGKPTGILRRVVPSSFSQTGIFFRPDGGVAGREPERGNSPAGCYLTRRAVSESKRQISFR